MSATRLSEPWQKITHVVTIRTTSTGGFEAEVTSPRVGELRLAANTVSELFEILARYFGGVKKCL